jgi:hypothetical protein
MFRATVCALTAGLVLAFAAHADVFRYVDENGNVMYTDRPSLLPAERLSIRSQRTDMVELDERTEDEAQAAAQRNQARQQASQNQTQQRRDAEANAASKAELCAKARQDYLARMNAQRLYEEQPNGERRYLTSEEIDATRATAKKAMDDMCN